MLHLTLSSTQNIMGSASTIRPIMGSASTIRPGISINHSDVKQCLCLWLPNPTNTQVINQPISTSRATSHTIGYFMFGDQTKEAMSPNLSQTLLSLWLTRPPNDNWGHTKHWNVLHNHHKQKVKITAVIMSQSKTIHAYRLTNQTDFWQKVLLCQGQ